VAFPRQFQRVSVLVGAASATMDIVQFGIQPGHTMREARKNSETGETGATATEKVAVATPMDG